MGATLDALHRLQEVELQIAEINRATDRKSRAVSRQELAIADLDKRITAAKASLQTEQVEADRYDLDVKSREAEIAKYRQALNQTKTNKEYSALLTQLNTYKTDMAKVEDKVLGMLNQTEARRKAIAELQAERVKEVTRLDELKASLESERSSTRSRLESLKAERDTAAKGVPAGALSLFNRVVKKNEGEALATIIRTHPKRGEYACGGCNMSVTIEQVNAVMSRDEAIPCNNCGRILYMEATVKA
jgi:predicted  nucleic acid-binding Zn-ribbon protein